MKLLLNERDRLYYKRKVAKDDESKENIGFEIQGISGKIKVVRDEIWMCKDIRTNSEKVEKDLREFEVVKNERKRQIEMEEKVKKKERKYER